MSDRRRRRERRNRGRAQSSSRRPGRSETRRARLRKGLQATRRSGAAKVLRLTGTRRAAIVAIVVCALAFTIAVPLRTYLSQRAEVAEQEARQAELKREVAQLERRKAQLSDPAQVEAEARRRLRYVMPGETPYMIQFPGEKSGEQRKAGQSGATSAATWYEYLWDSIVRE